ncbi:MAG: hypothetical protein QM744_01215 [Mesorhizobium sp.]
MALEARLKRIEDLEGRMHPQQQYRFCRIAADDEEEAEIKQDIIAQGYDPETDLFLIRLVPLQAEAA